MAEFHTSQPVCVCVCLCESVCVPGEYSKSRTTTLAHFLQHTLPTQTNKSSTIRVCVRRGFAGGEGREVSSAGNKSICWLLTEWEIKTSQWSIFITSLLSFSRTGSVSAGHMIFLYLSLALPCSLLKACVLTLWPRLAWREAGESWFPCRLAAVQGHYGDGGALPESELSPPDTH